MPRAETSLAIIFVLSLLGEQRTLADDSLKQRFLREAPQGWKRLREAEQRIVGKLHWESWSINKGKRTNWGMDRSAFFQRDGDLTALAVEQKGTTGTTVLTVGPRYTFRLTRSSSSSPYVVRDLAVGPPDVAGEGSISSTYFYRSIQASRELWNVPLSDLIADPGFVLKGISEATDDGKAVVKVEFECKVSKYNQEHFTDAWMTLSPADGWVLLGAEYWLRKDYRTTITNEYRPNRSGRSAIYRHYRVHHYPDQAIDEHHRFTLDELEDRAVPESAFTLTAFGVAEPGDVGSTAPGRAIPASFPEPGRSLPSSYGSTLHYWFFAGAVALLGTALALRWAARRAV